MSDPESESRLPPQVTARMSDPPSEESNIDQSLSDGIPLASMQHVRPDLSTHETEEAISVSRDLSNSGDCALTGTVPAPPTLHPPVVVGSDVSPGNSELWPATAGEAFAGLPKGWQRKRTAKGRRYYMDHKRNTTTWARPAGGIATPPESAPPGGLHPEAQPYRYSPAQQSYLAQVQAESKTILERGQHVKRNTRCTIISKTSPRHDINLPESTIFLDHHLQIGEDVVCIIDDISAPWIAAFGVSYGIPTEFLARHLAGRRLASTMHVLAIELLSSIEECMERLLRIAQIVVTEQQSLLLTLDELSEALAYARSAVDAWDSISVTNNTDELGKSCRTNIQILKDAHSRLRKIYSYPQTDNTASLLRAIKAIRMALDTFKVRRQNPWYCQRIALYSDSPRKTTLMSLTSDDNDIYETWSEGYLSYIRLRKSLFLILTTCPKQRLGGLRMPEPDLGSSTGVSTINYYLRPMHEGFPLSRYPILPEGSQDTYDLLRHFVIDNDDWLPEVFCAEEEQEMINGDEDNFHVAARDDGHRYMALDPQAFIYLFTSFLWNRELERFERLTRAISFRNPQDQDPQDTIQLNNDLLTAYRQKLDALIRLVSHARAHAPAYLEAYYGTFPAIRWRHQARDRSPLDQLSNILTRARDLQRLLIDSFQMLMSSVSVQQAAVTARLAADTAKQASASAEQATAATRITALAFVYIPLTFVTGIFGMNIRIGNEDPKGFIWYAPLVTLGVAIGFTAALWYAAEWIAPRLTAWREKRRSKAKAD